MASYQADHSFMSHKGMQLVPEKNKEREFASRLHPISRLSYRAAPAGPLNQCLHVPVLVTWNFLPSWALQTPCIAVWSTSLGRILLPAQTWLTQQQLRQGKWPQGRKNGEAGRLWRKSLHGPRQSQLKHTRSQTLCSSHPGGTSAVQFTPPGKCHHHPPG